MISLSLYNGHNAAICIMKDGYILLNWELERFSRIKHDYGFNQKFLDKSLDHCNLTIDDIDVILTNQQSFGRNPPWNVPETKDVDYRSFEINGKKAYAVNHHLCHVASSYFTSPFDSATIITQDGGGDNENFSWAQASGNKITKFGTEKVKNIAGWWSGITMNNYRMPRLHKWDPGSGAGKIMALAAYGNTNDELEAKLEQDLLSGAQPHYTDKHGTAYNNDEDLSDSSTQKSKDVAAALQSLTEKEVGKIYDRILDRNPNDNLCIAGGIALNCVANTRVKSKFKNLHCPPFPNDTGLAAGMAFWYWHHCLENPKSNELFIPYLGPEYKEQETLDVLEKSGYNYKELTIDNLAEVLISRSVICLARGRSESGPRALGHRSIMCIPDSEHGRDYLNDNIKKREWYRPYAPIILDKYVDDILEDYLPVSPYMSTSGTIKREWRDDLDAVNHVDNSTRPQIITMEQEPFIYTLIEKIYEQTGIPVLLNTSFNMQEPIVETPQEAINTFSKFEIDYLALHNYLVSKK